MSRISNWPRDFNPNSFAGCAVSDVEFSPHSVKIVLAHDGGVPDWWIRSHDAMRHIRDGAVDDYAFQSHDRHGPSHLPEIVGCNVVRSSINRENDALTLELDNGHSITFLVTGYESYQVHMGEKRIYM